MPFSDHSCLQISKGPLVAKDSDAKMAWRRTGKLAGMVAGLHGKVMDTFAQQHADVEVPHSGSGMNAGGGGGGGGGGATHDSMIP